MASIPLELILQILTLSMQSVQPVDLKFLVSGNKVESNPKPNTEKAPNLLQYVGAEAQDQHQHDWTIATSVCHAWRKIGKKAFFQQKVFLITPGFLKRLYEDEKCLSSASRAALFSQVRHVIVLVPCSVGWVKCVDRDQWLDISHVHKLIGLKNFHLLLHHDHKDWIQYADLPDAYDVALPEFFLYVLERLHLDINRLEPRLLVSKTAFKTIALGVKEVGQTAFWYMERLPNHLIHGDDLDDYSFPRFTEEGGDFAHLLPYHPWPTPEQEEFLQTFPGYPYPEAGDRTPYLTGGPQRVPERTGIFEDDCS
ncbi:uncharacterized protein KY384_003456 [Bacidia gigantensis]|uniref:uncharacterized protein n=1 Tax=Bacidia gigantensis TaxID=2732470 RepID=UPI001D04F1E3|nr:uncharacterized protein KY384_003456 [Bacidia gigantensis]KAG8531820.1 hypothetical protein KY384_003456 [Bacidia gigantensis]